jgi:hypothetical protein
MGAYGHGRGDANPHRPKQLQVLPNGIQLLLASVALLWLPLAPPLMAGGGGGAAAAAVAGGGGAAAAVSNLTAVPPRLLMSDVST